MRSISPLQVFTVYDYFSGAYLGNAHYILEKRSGEFPPDPDAPVYEQWRQQNQSISVFVFCDGRKTFYEDEFLLRPLFIQ